LRISEHKTFQNFPQGLRTDEMKWREDAKRVKEVKDKKGFIREKNKEPRRLLPSADCADSFFVTLCELGGEITRLLTTEITKNHREEDTQEPRIHAD
jgi:hypothetical protein